MNEDIRNEINPCDKVKGFEQLGMKKRISFSFP